MSTGMATDIPGDFSNLADSTIFSTGINVERPILSEVQFFGLV